MNSEGSFVVARFGRPAYAVALYLVFHALLSVASASWPLDFGSVIWRYGMESTLSSFLTPTLLALLIGAAAASGLRHPTVARAVGWLAGLSALVWAALSIDFGLCGLQVRRQVTEDNVSALKVAVARGCVLYVVAAVIAAWLALESFRSARRLNELHPEDETAHPLVSI